MKILSPIRSESRFAIEADKTIFICRGILIANLIKDLALVELRQVALKVKVTHVLDIRGIFRGPSILLFLLSHLLSPFGILLLGSRKTSSRRKVSTWLCRCMFLYQWSLAPALCLELRFLLQRQRLIPWYGRSLRRAVLGELALSSATSLPGVFDRCFQWSSSDASFRYILELCNLNNAVAIQLAFTVELQAGERLM